MNYRIEEKQAFEMFGISTLVNSDGDNPFIDIPVFGRSAYPTAPLIESVQLRVWGKWSDSWGTIQQGRWRIFLHDRLLHTPEWHAGRV